MSTDTLHTTDTNASVAVQHLSFRYRVVTDDKQGRPASALPPLPRAIEDISFSLAAGELLLLAGPGGCAKSTLLKYLNGLIPDSYKGILSGEISLEGRSISGLLLRELACQIGTLLQDLISLHNMRFRSKMFSDEVLWSISFLSFMEYPRLLPALDALLFITHDLDLALPFTQRFLLLQDGQLVADGLPLQVLADPALLDVCNLRPTSLLRYLLSSGSFVA